jgi:hypothetical protein
MGWGGYLVPHFFTISLPEQMSEAVSDKNTALMEKIVSLCKRRGFIFQSAEIYGGLNGCWDYGPLGAELKRNLKEYWWRKNVQEREDILGLDGSILTHQEVLKASGHVGGFSDPMADCLLTKARLRADQIEPQSGTAYHYTGASHEESGWSAEHCAPILRPVSLRQADLAEKARVGWRIDRGSGEFDSLQPRQRIVADRATGIQPDVQDAHGSVRR